MDEKQLATIFYQDAIRVADEREAPRSAIAAAMLRGAMQVFVDAEGPYAAADWLEREAKTFRRALS